MNSMTMAYSMNSAMRTSTLFGFHNYKKNEKNTKYIKRQTELNLLQLRDVLTSKTYPISMFMAEIYILYILTCIGIASHATDRHSFISTHILHIQPTTSPLSSPLSIFLNLYLSLNRQIKTQFHNNRWRLQEVFQKYYNSSI